MHVASVDSATEHETDTARPREERQCLGDGKAAKMLLKKSGSADESSNF